MTTIFERGRAARAPGSPSVDRRTELRAAAVTMGAVLATFGTSLALRGLTGASAGISVLGVVLALTLSRVGRGGQDGPRATRLLPLLVTPSVALLASEVADLSRRHRTVGEVLFTAAVSGAVWARRFGPVGTWAGTLATLPFIALLVTPVPPGEGPTSRLNLVAIALIAIGWVTIARHAEARLFAPGPPRRPARREQPTARPVAADRTAPPSAPGVAPPSAPGIARRRRRLPASTRMAVQLAVALGAAFAVGRHVFGEHRSWLVLTAYLVHSGNRGRGDVAYRCAQRLAGAAVGTAAATVVAGRFPAGDDVSIVLIFVLLALGVWLRSASYAYWTACVTGVLALLYGYYGQTGTGLLRERLAAVVLGAAIGLAAAWFVLPVRTGDVLRRRIADLLAALTDYLVVCQTGRARMPRPSRTTPEVMRAALADAHDRLETAFDQLALVAPPLRAHRALTRRPRRHRRPGQAIRPHRYDAVAALLACRPALCALTRELDARGAPPGPVARRDIARARTIVVETRRAMGRAAAAAARH
ncbi:MULTISPECIES: FUSC family protein [Frankia]|nr:MULTISPECIES: FUSC family protein [Frankia]